MIDANAIGEIISTYEKHGWILRRVLLCGNAVNDTKLRKALNNAEIRDAEVNAAWFSRPPAQGKIAWELRYLGSVQFAMVEHVDEDSQEFEAQLSAIEAQLLKAISVKDTA